MLSKTHLGIALTLYLVFFTFFNVSLNPYNFILFMIFIISTVLPDIDKSNSLIGRYVPLIGLISKHRGFFHSLIFAIILSIVLMIFISVTVSIYFFLGYFLHILLDSFSKEGIKVLGFKIKGFIKVGGLTENIIYLLSLFFIGILVIINVVLY